MSSRSLGFMNDAPQPADELVDVFGVRLPRGACHGVAITALFLLTLALFADVLFTPGDLVIGDKGADLLWFINLRQFGFGELHDGNLAMWNPHNACGEPFFPMFQTGLLYPLNVGYLLLSPAKAVSFTVALHIFLAGLFMYGWMNGRRLHPLACFVCAVLWMMSGPYWPHVSAGHLTPVASIIWAPLLLLAIDRIFDGLSLQWMLVGAFAVAMQILAGHPQCVFYTLIAAAVYSCLRLVKSTGRLLTLATLGMIVASGLGLAAVQLLPGIAVGAEIIRSKGLSFSEASTFSFPPQNFITFIAPGFFNRTSMVDYWGRWFSWEVMGYFSIAGVVLAIYGAVAAERNARRFSLTMTVLFAILALGSYTPLFKVLYEFVPGFNKFRGNAKFMFVAVMFLIALAGAGLDQLLRQERPPKWLSRMCIVVAAVLAVGAIAIAASGLGFGPQWWRSVVMASRDSLQSFLPAPAWASADFVRASATTASASLALAAAVFALIAALLLMALKSARFIAALAVVAIAEMLIFAWHWRDTFHLSENDVPPLKRLLASNPGDYRILNLLDSGMAPGLGARDLWGDDPAVLRRYAELMAFTQALAPEQATQALTFKKISPLFRLLRCKFIISPKPGKQLESIELPNPLPRFLLVHACRVLPKRDDILSALSSPDFKFEEEVCLESQPAPLPVPSRTKGTVKLLASSTDDCTVMVNAASDSILLITDAYSRDWRATDLDSKSALKILPADYCLMAIPVPAGNRRIQIDYVPRGFMAGKWISIGSAILFCLGATVAGVRRKR